MKLISCVLIFYATMEGCNTQFDFGQLFNQQQPQQPQQPNFAYQTMPQNNYYENNQQMSPFLMNNNYNYQPECECSCDSCHNPNPCCFEFCAKCVLASNPAFIYYPYPYIILASQRTTQKPVAEVPTTKATTTVAPTTTEATSTTVEPKKLLSILAYTTEKAADSLRGNLLKELIYNPSESKQDNDDIIMTAMRRTKPRWMPKFGIVPIPDQLAEKLMLRIRHMKVLHPGVDTIRRTVPIYS